MVCGWFRSRSVNFLKHNNMYINFFVLIVICSVIFYLGTWMGSKYFYNARHHIKLLWRQQLKIARAIGNARQEKNEEQASYLEELYDPDVEKRGELIDALLLHYFNPQNLEEKEYIRRYKYSKVWPPIIKKQDK